MTELRCRSPDFKKAEWGLDGQNITAIHDPSTLILFAPKYHIYFILFSFMM